LSTAYGAAVQLLLIEATKYNFAAAGVLAPSQAQENIIDIAPLPPGLYVLRLQDGAASSVGRFVKE
jgi:hypothetical protein